MLPAFQGPLVCLILTRGEGAAAQNVAIGHQFDSSPPLTPPHPTCPLVSEQLVLQWWREGVTAHPLHCLGRCSNHSHSACGGCCGPHRHGCTAGRAHAPAAMLMSAVLTAHTTVQLEPVHTVVGGAEVHTGLGLCGAEDPALGV